MKACRRLCSGIALAAALAAAAGGGMESGRDAARDLLDASGVRGGLAVFVGVGGVGTEGAPVADWAEALGRREGFTVHAMDADPAVVDRWRARSADPEFVGRMSADAIGGADLPHIDNLVNLLVVADASPRIPVAEMLRALAPLGVAMIRGEPARDAGEGGRSVTEIQGTPWTRIVKPWPAAIDEWTHYLHDASNNPVAQDSVIGPPKHVQWIGTPEYLRHHDHMSGLGAMVSAAGRLFTILDLGPRWSVQMPPRWTLMARDAFNGVELWQRPIKSWHPHLWSLKKGPADLMRRLVAVGDSVYVTMGIGGPVSVLDAATGRTLRTMPGTEGAEEIVWSDGTLLVLANPDGHAYAAIPGDSVDSIRGAAKLWMWDEKPRRLLALHAETGERLWERESAVAPVTVAAAGGRVYFHDGERIRCLDGRDGREIWASDPMARWKPMHVLFAPNLIVYDDVVLFAGGENMDPLKGGKDTMTALSAETGRVLWAAPHPPSGYASAEDLMVVDGLVWCGETTSRRDSGVFTGRDPRTGDVVREFPPDDWQPHMPHHRCHRAKAAGRFILTSRTGIEFVDVRDQTWISHHWVRGSCNYGILPANGLIYAPPHSCACYQLAKLTGFHALAPARTGRSAPASGERLIHGPAHAAIPDPAPDAGVEAADWPTYRGNAARGGATRDVVPADLKRAWSADILGRAGTAGRDRLSPPVAAGGRVFVAAVDRRQVHALDAKTGRALWVFTAGGRVDSPPTVWNDRVIFGSADGWIYALRSVDGGLIWRFRAAPDERRMMAREQMESPWPVHGSVLVRDGEVYAVAGRSMWLDGGMRMVRLDAGSGRLLSETTLDDIHPEHGGNLQEDVQWPNLPVALSDILSTDGQHIYMRSQPFDLEGRRIDVSAPKNYKEQDGPTAHLFSPTGFLDDSWWHRTYWMHGRSFVSGAGGWYLGTYQAPAGRILAVDDDSVFGFGRMPHRFSGTPNTYHLFACALQPERIDPNPGKGVRKRGSAMWGDVIPTLIRYRWSSKVPMLVRAIAAAEGTLFVAGPPAEADEDDVYARYGQADAQEAMGRQIDAFEGRSGGLLLAVSKADGGRRSAYRLASPPVFDGLAAAGGRLLISTMDGRVECLGADGEDALEPAPEVAPSSAADESVKSGGSRTHPDFGVISKLRVSASDLGYHLTADSGETGFALRPLTPPATGRIRISARVRARPGHAPDTPGNAFLAFGDGTDDKNLVKCGFRISGQRLYIHEGASSSKSAPSVPVSVQADRVMELSVVVDLDARRIVVSLDGVELEAELRHPLKAVSWIGCSVVSVDAEFSPIDVTSP